MTKNNLTLTEIHNLFYLLNDTLYWKVGKRKDNIAGSVSTRGYVNVEINNKTYKLHRILYQIYNNVHILGPNDVIDHIDGDTTNNEKSNLRICEQTNNSQNQKIKSSNKVGVKGVSIYKDHPQTVYLASIKINKVTRIFKRFQYNESGLLSAKMWLEEMRNVAHKDFCNHG